MREERKVEECSALTSRRVFFPLMYRNSLAQLEAALRPAVPVGQTDPLTVWEATSHHARAAHLICLPTIQAAFCTHHTPHL